MAGNKYLSNNAGQITEVASNNTSAGATDAGKLVSLNASGILDSTIVNSKTTSAGAADSGKIVALNASGLVDPTIINSKNTSVGAADAAKVPVLDGTGKLDMSFMPVGLGAETDVITASEALSAGDFVNVWNSAGAKVRKADGSTSGKEAQGFVLAAYSSSASATVYRISQLNNQLTGMTPGAKQYLSATVPGGRAETAPSSTGQTVQCLGVAKSATEIIFQPTPSIELA